MISVYKNSNSLKASVLSYLDDPIRWVVTMFDYFLEKDQNKNC